MSGTSIIVNRRVAVFNQGIFFSNFACRTWIMSIRAPAGIMSYSLC